MNTEIKKPIEDAAKLLGLEVVDWRGSTPVAVDNQGLLHGFNPLDPERGDLMKVAEAVRKAFKLMMDGRWRGDALDVLADRMERGEA